MQWRTELGGGFGGLNPREIPKALQNLVKLNSSPSLRSIQSTPSQLHSLQQIPTQHDMLTQHLFYKNELNREYVITLSRNDESP